VNVSSAKKNHNVCIQNQYVYSRKTTPNAFQLSFSLHKSDLYVTVFTILFVQLWLEHTTISSVYMYKHWSHKKQYHLYHTSSWISRYHRSWGNYIL